MGPPTHWANRIRPVTTSDYAGVAEPVARLGLARGQDDGRDIAEPGDGMRPLTD